MVESDAKERMRGDTLQAAINEDKAKGLIPFYVNLHSLPFIYEGFMMI